MQYKGTIPYDEIKEVYKRAKVMVNLSYYRLFGLEGYPNLDYTTLEAIKYGAIPITLGRPAYPFAKKDYICCDNRTVEEVANRINNVIENWDKLTQIRQTNLELLKYFDAKEVAKRLLEFMKLEQKE